VGEEKMTPMETAWLVLKYEGGFFTQPPAMEMDEEKIAEYEKGRDRSGRYPAFFGDDYSNALYQQEEVAALNEAIRQELRRQMDAKSGFHFGEFDSGFMPDASPMMRMREHNFPKAGEPFVPTGAKGTFVMRPYRGADHIKKPLPIRAPVIRSRRDPEYNLNMKNRFDPDGGEFIGE
jgi:hypothetical protein